MLDEVKAVPTACEMPFHEIQRLHVDLNEVVTIIDTRPSCSLSVAIPAVLLASGHLVCRYTQREGTHSRCTAQKVSEQHCRHTAPRLTRTVEGLTVCLKAVTGVGLPQEACKALAHAMHIAVSCIGKCWLWIRVCCTTPHKTNSQALVDTLWAVPC